MPGRRKTPSKIEILQEKVEGKLNKDWGLSQTVCPPYGYDIYGFRESDYVSFLDTVRTLSDLCSGLRELSPFADDALAVAETMNEMEFIEFKLCLAHERRIARVGYGESKLLPRHSSLVVPRFFLQASPIAERFNVPIGATMVRLIEEGVGVNSRVI